MINLVWICPLRVGAVFVLKELMIVLPNSLSGHMGSLVPGIECWSDIQTLLLRMCIDATVESFVLITT